MILLLWRYKSERHLPDLILAIILLLTCYQRTTYTIGFMGWYDEFKNTKINYFLINVSIAIGPLIYLYVKSVTTANFRFSRRDLLHFIPFAFSFSYELFVFCYDALQPGFDETQNGIWLESIHYKYFSTFTTVFSWVHFTTYLVLALQLYRNYVPKVRKFYSNIFNLELRWVRNFVLIYLLLFVYSFVQEIVQHYFIELNWIQTWWYHFFAAVAIIYVGIFGYFVDTDKLQDLEFNSIDQVESKNLASSETQIDTSKIAALMRDQRPYLNPDLTLKTMSDLLGYNPSQLSELINKGLKMNFNDYINSHRVEAVKKMLNQGSHKQLSFVGIAYECGFNSKATFNRVFKKVTGLSPSQYVKSQ